MNGDQFFESIAASTNVISFAERQPWPLVRAGDGGGGYTVLRGESPPLPELTRNLHVSEYATCITGNDPSGAGG